MKKHSFSYTLITCEKLKTIEPQKKKKTSLNFNVTYSFMKERVISGTFYTQVLDLKAMVMVFTLGYTHIAKIAESLW